MNKIYNVFISLAFLFLVSCAATESQEMAASDTDPSGTGEMAAVDSKAASRDDELICRRVQMTGTNFRRRVCQTRADMERETRDSQEEMLERRSAVRGNF